MEWFSYLYWFIFALLLILAETLGAAGFLIALGTAAAAVGFISWIWDVVWQWQLIYFSILSLFFAIAWWLCLKRRTTSADSFMNRPFNAMIGHTAVLTEPIVNGCGKIKINDGYWFVTGPDLPAGCKVKIIAIEDSTLMVVEPI